MKSVIFVFFVPFCIASAENLQSNEANSNNEMTAVMNAPGGEDDVPAGVVHEPVVEHAETPVERSPSPVPEIPSALDEKEDARKHAEPDSKSIRTLPDAPGEPPMAIVASVSRTESVLNLESRFSHEMTMHKLKEILENLHEDFETVRDQLKNAKTWMARLIERIKNLNDILSGQAKLTGKKKSEKKIMKIENECYEMLSNSEEIMSGIETKMREIEAREFGEARTRLNRSQAAVLIYRAEYELLEQKLKELKRNHNENKKIVEGIASISWKKYVEKKTNKKSRKLK